MNVQDLTKITDPKTPFIINPTVCAVKKEINNLKKDINGKNKTSKGIIKEKKLYDSIQFTSPKIRVNQNGCVLSLDRFGNLFFISFENLKKNSFTSISKIETNLIE